MRRIFAFHPVRGVFLITDRKALARQQFGNSVPEKLRPGRAATRLLDFIGQDIGYPNPYEYLICCSHVCHTKCLTPIRQNHQFFVDGC